MVQGRYLLLQGMWLHAEHASRAQARVGHEALVVETIIRHWYRGRWAQACYVFEVVKLQQVGQHRSF